MGRPAALVDRDWHEQAINVVEQIVRRQGTVTAEDLRREFDSPESHTQIGPVFQHAHRLKLITPLSYRPSRDKSRNAGLLTVWGLHPSQKEKAPGSHAEGLKDQQKSDQINASSLADPSAEQAHGRNLAAGGDDE